MSLEFGVVTLKGIGLAGIIAVLSNLILPHRKPSTETAFKEEPVVAGE